MGTDNNEENKSNNKRDLLVGATALLSVIAVPVTILAGMLLGDKKKK